jgi:hypothetical protein
MPLSGKGMLITIMDADPAREEDFNKWYDREHIVERVAIAGFLEARRYVAVRASPKYLNFYTTENLEILNSPAYRNKLQNATPWTRHHTPRFLNYTRVVARVTGSKGQGRGGALAFGRVRPSGINASELRNAILAQLDVVVDLDRIISAHLIEADRALSNPQGESNAQEGSGDWYMIVEGTDAEAVRQAGDQRFGRRELLPQCDLISFGTYRLLWDLAKAELNR